MKKKSLLVVLVMLLGMFSLSALEISPGWTYGAELGISRGDNAGSRENLAPMGRGFLQLEIFKFLYMRTGVGYTPLHASQTYATDTFMGDTRFIFNPLHDKKYSPFLFAGAGAALELGDPDADVIPLYPLGLGMQIELKRGLDLELTGAYYHSNSDLLDTQLYPQDTTDKRDGFWGLTVGLAFSDPAPVRKPTPKPVVVEKPAPKPEPVVEIPVVVTPPAPKPEPVVEKPVVVTPPAPKPEPVVEEPTVDLKAIDTDKDGLSDYDEMYVYMTDPKKADTDGDGLTDYSEVLQYKTDPLKADTDGDSLSDGAEIAQYKTEPLKPDTDGDGLMDGEEILSYKTDPLKIDTDGDGLNDGMEVKEYKIDPLKRDTDGDGLSDDLEVEQYKTDPLKADTDGDGLNDAMELNQYKTDPLKADTDGDGLIDGMEVNQYKTDALKADTDEDGLNDGAEVNQHKTNPLNTDTDGDDLSDYDEVVQYKTDPLKADSDGDTLTDFAEVMQHKTDPLVMDTDKGTVDDGTEVADDKDPLDPKDDILDLTVGASFSLEGIFFETAKSTILPASVPKLEQAYSALEANPGVKILIVGHTDNVGSDASNMTLSQNRAAAVKKWLVDRGIAADRIRTEGKGETQPRATNATTEGRALNRRIEFVVE